MTLLAKIHGRDPDDVMREFINADPKVGVDAALTQRNEEQAQEAIDAAHKGDYSLLGERREARLTTPQEKEFLDLGGRASRPRGRPLTMRKRHPRIAFSIEAFRATGLSKRAAIVETARAWGLSEDTVGNLWKKFNLSEEVMNCLREYFAGFTTEEVQEAIKQWRSAYK